MFRFQRCFATPHGHSGQEFVFSSPKQPAAMTNSAEHPRLAQPGRERYEHSSDTTKPSFSPMFCGAEPGPLDERSLKLKSPTAIPQPEVCYARQQIDFCGIIHTLPSLILRRGPRF
jgi:hypothetical protein